MPLPLLAIAMAAGSAAQGLATIGSGIMSAKANKAQQLGAQIEASMARLRGKQIAAEARGNLLTTNGAISAIRTTRGVSSDSQTGQAIQRRTRQDAYRSEAVAVLGEMTRAGNADMAAKGYGTAARWAIPMSVLNSAGSFASAASYGKAAMGGRR